MMQQKYDSTTTKPAIKSKKEKQGCLILMGKGAVWINELHGGGGWHACGLTMGCGGRDGVVVD